MITLLYFAALKDLMGTGQESIELPPSVRDVRALAQWLEDVRPALRGRLGSVRFAVDESFAGPEGPVQAGSVVALIPPVAGG
jgi:molybdopterin converting factor subunit 1